MSDYQVIILIFAVGALVALQWRANTLLEMILEKLNAEKEDDEDFD